MSFRRSPGPIKLQRRQGSDRSLVVVEMESPPGVMSLEDAKSPFSPKGRKRTIRFSPYDSVIEIPHIDDLPQDEIDAVWLHPDDFQKMREECIARVGIMDESSQPFDFCVRGLDQHIPKYLAMRDALQHLQYDTLGRIQAIQEVDGKDYTDVLAQLCQTCSRLAVSNAVALGIADALAADASDTLVAGI
jgi:hypothetical protein